MPDATVFAPTSHSASCNGLNAESKGLTALDCTAWIRGGWPSSPRWSHASRNADSVLNKSEPFPTGSTVSVGQSSVAMTSPANDFMPSINHGLRACDR